MKKAKVIDYEITNHGYDHSQYFQGCGTYGTSFDLAYTGAGNNAKEAYNAALEQVYMSDIDSASIDKLLPKRPRGINAKDKVPAKLANAEDSEIYWYVSIRLKFEE